MSESSAEIPVKGVVPITQLVGDDDEDTRLLRDMALGAEHYLRHFPWCKKIRDAYFGNGCGGIVAVFLFHIAPSRVDVDEWLWVIFGDLPPAYLVIDECKTPSQTLEKYIQEVSKWARLAKQRVSSVDVIPVYIPATPENAADVENRLNFIRDTILPAFREAEQA